MIKGWIKASDRLPVDGKLVEIKLDYITNIYARWVDDENAFVNSVGTRYPPTLYYIEWLDESPADGEAVAVMKEAVQLIEYMHQLTDVPKHLVEDYGNKYCNTISMLDKSIKSLTAPEGV